MKPSRRRRNGPVRGLDSLLQLLPTLDPLALRKKHEKQQRNYEEGDGDDDDHFGPHFHTLGFILEKAQ